MKSTDTLRQMQECYERFHPADEKSEEAFIWFSKVPHPFFNVVMDLTPGKNFQEKIDTILSTTPPDFPYTFWVIDHPSYAAVSAYLQEKGCTPFYTCSLMRWEVVSTAPMDADVQRADSDLFYHILDQAYTLGESIQKPFIQLLAQAKAENVLLYLGEKPISTISLVPCGYQGGIFNEAVVPGFESHKPILIQNLMQRAYQLRLMQLVALSAPDYEKTYLDLGFEKTGEVVLYLPPLKK